MSSEISNLCEFSHLLLCVSYFACQSKVIDYFFDVLCVKKTFDYMPDTHIKLQYGHNYNRRKILDLNLDLIYISVSISNPNPTHLLKNPTPNH